MQKLESGTTPTHMNMLTAIISIISNLLTSIRSKILLDMTIETKAIEENIKDDNYFKHNNNNEIKSSSRADSTDSLNSVFLPSSDGAESDSEVNNFKLLCCRLGDERKGRMRRDALENKQDLLKKKKKSGAYKRRLRKNKNLKFDEKLEN